MSIIIPKDPGYYENPREDLVSIIPSGAMRVLDIGCGNGRFGATLKAGRPGAEVVGVELDAAVAEKAKSVLDRVIVGDIEKVPLDFPEKYFDCIVYADVLEHLANPWEVLRRHRTILKDGGHLAASIPNIAHYRILKMLRRKEWCYKKSGILDECHIRFFTIKSIEEMLEDAGFKITGIKHIVSASKVKKFLNKVFFNSLIDSITEQYLIIAQKIP